jgi:hypothetical protein
LVLLTKRKDIWEGENVIFVSKNLHVLTSKNGHAWDGDFEGEMKIWLID